MFGLVTKALVGGVAVYAINRALTRTRALDPAIDAGVEIVGEFLSKAVDAARTAAAQAMAPAPKATS